MLYKALKRPPKRVNFNFWGQLEDAEMKTEELSEFLTAYANHVRTILVPTRNELKEVFRQWKEPTHWASRRRRTRLPAPSPVQRAFPRIKRPESVVDKILRNPSFYSDALCLESVHRMYDAIGGRVIVYFLSNLPLIDREIREGGIFELSKEDEPIAYLSDDVAKRHGLSKLKRMHKDSGYASIHYTVRLLSTSIPKNQRPWVEIQVRTLAEDVWGEIEHILGYKPEKRTSFAVRRQFQILSSELTAIDEHFNLLYEELSRFQDEVTYADTNPLNAENLPPVLNELGIGCAQREIDGLLKLLASRGYETVGDLRENASPRSLELVRNTFRSIQGREPGNFDIVAGIAAIRNLGKEDEIIEAVKAQIEFLNAWERIKQEIG